MVKKLLILFMVLGIATVASATTMTLTRSGSGTLNADDTEKIYVYVDDSKLDSLGTTLNITNGTFTVGIAAADADDYGVQATAVPTSWGGGVTTADGWGTGLSNDTALTLSDTRAQIGLGMFESVIHGATDLDTLADVPANETFANILYEISVAWIEIKSAGTGDMELSWSNGSDLYGSSWETDLTTVPGFGPTLTIPAVPEPMTIALLGLGGLFLRRRK